MRLTRTTYHLLGMAFPRPLRENMEIHLHFEPASVHGCERNHKTLLDNSNQLSTTAVLVLVLVYGSRVSTKIPRQVPHSSDLNLARTRTLEVTSPGNLDRG